MGSHCHSDSKSRALAGSSSAAQGPTWAAALVTRDRGTRGWALLAGEARPSKAEARALLPHANKIRTRKQRRRQGHVPPSKASGDLAWLNTSRPNKALLDTEPKTRDRSPSASWGSRRCLPGGHRWMKLSPWSRTAMWWATAHGADPGAEAGRQVLGHVSHSPARQLPLLVRVPRQAVRHGLMALEPQSPFGEECGQLAWGVEA